MDKNDRMFTSKRVDEQIDQLLDEQPSPLSEQSLINSLQRMYQDDERSLEKVWQRLGLESGLRAGAERQPATLRSVQLAIQSSARARKHTLGRNRQMHQESQSSIARNLSLIAATLVAALIVGSMLWVFNLSHHNTNTAAPKNLKQQQATQPNLVPGIYVSNKDGLFRLESQTRKVFWQLPLKNVIKIIPSGNLVYVLQSRGQYASSTVPNAVYAIDANTGSIHWTHAFTAQRLDRSTFTLATDLDLSDGQLYVGMQTLGSNIEAYVGQIYVLNALDGRQLGVYANFQYIGVMAVGDGILGVGADNNLQVYDTISGKLLWHVFIKAPTNSPVRVVHIINGLVYAVVSTSDEQTGSGQSYIIAYKARTGEQVWKSPIFPGDGISFTVDRSTLYFGTLSFQSAGKPFAGSVYAYDVLHNKQLWSRDVHGGVQQAPIVSNGIVYVGADGGIHFSSHIVALVAESGTVKWRQQLDGSITEGFCVTNGTVYAGNFSVGNSQAFANSPVSASGALDALNAQDGSKLWEDTQHGFPLFIAPTS